MDKKLIKNLSQNEGQDKQLERYQELTVSPLRRENYIDPSLGLEFAQRRSFGCYACLHSKRRELRGKVRSYCQPMEDGICTQDYPNETKDTCSFFCDKKKKRVDTV